MRKFSLLTVLMALLLGGAVYGQNATKGSDPIALSGTSCADDALHPIAGKTYTYTATVNPDGGTAKWWATKDPAFITAGGDNSSSALTVGNELLAANNYTTDETVSGGSTEANINWGTDILANTVSGTDPTFVVVKYDAPAEGCANNLKVYQIDPINAFTVDIKNMTNDPTTQVPLDDYSDTYSSCVSAVEGATYSTTAQKMVYDYGTNELYFEVVAANFSNAYTPTFELSGLEAGQTADIDWGYAAGTYDQPLETGVVDGTYTGTKVITNETNTHEGVSIYVKVTLHNGTYETLSTQNVSLAVVGENTAGLNDIKNDDCSTKAQFADNTATQDINPRPTVGDNTTGGTFVPSSN